MTPEEMKKKMDAMEAEKADMQKKMDAMEAKNDAFEKMADEQKNKKSKEDEEEDEKKNEKKNDAAQVAYFNERNDALALASRRGVEIQKEWTNAQIKTAVVKEALGDLRTDSVDALNGAYEAVAKMTPEKNSTEHLQFTTARNDSQVEPKGGDGIFDFYDERRNDAIFNFKNQE